MSGTTDLTPPRLEGTFAVGDRRLGFAEFGKPRGRAVLWLHGTPGARRQVPEAARAIAHKLGLRIVGVDRPGVGKSTPHRYESIRGFADDVLPLLDAIGIDRFAVIGLSGGGPYALACAQAMPDRVMAVGLIGSVAPTCGPDAAIGGPVDLTRRLQHTLLTLRTPLSVALTTLVWTVRPVAEPLASLYARVGPEADRRLLDRPEVRAMFLDDILMGSKSGFRAVVDDLILFGHDWGFRLADVRVPVHAWHGADDHLVPHAHGEHLVSRLPDAQLHTMPGESHLGGIAEAENILRTLNATWSERSGDRRNRRLRTV